MTTKTTVKVQFTREFRKGLLKGIRHDDTISFVSYARAQKWLKGIDTNPNLDYVIAAYSIEKN